MMPLSMAMKAYVHYLMKNARISLLHKEPDVFVSGYLACSISISPQSGEMTFIKDPNVFRDLLLSLNER